MESGKKRVKISEKTMSDLSPNLSEISVSSSAIESLAHLCRPTNKNMQTNKKIADIPPYFIF